MSAFQSLDLLHSESKTYYLVISSDSSSKSDFLFDVVIFQNRDATSLTELHGNLIAGLETISRNGMS